MKKQSSDASTCHPTKLRRSNSFVLQKPKKSESFGLPRRDEADSYRGASERGDTATEATVSEQTLWSINSSNAASPAEAGAETSEEQSRARGYSQDTTPSLKPSVRRPLPPPPRATLDAPSSSSDLDVNSTQDPNNPVSTEDPQQQPQAQNATVSNTANDEVNFHVIQDWHAVLGDRHCAVTGRTTTATKMLKEIKQEFREDYVGKHGKRWYEAAIRKYHERMAQAFPHISAQDRGRVLVQCTEQVLASDRVMDTCTYGYQGKEALYGPAKVPEAIHFFFKSKDPPVLEKEMGKCRETLQSMRSNKVKRPPEEMLNEFEDFLCFIERKMDAPHENIMAKEILESVRWIPLLRRHSRFLRKHVEPVPPPSVAMAKNTTTVTAASSSSCAGTGGQQNAVTAGAGATTTAVSARDSMATAKEDHLPVSLDNFLVLDETIDDAKLPPLDGENATDLFDMPVPALEPMQTTDDWEPLPFAPPPTADGLPLNDTPAPGSQSSSPQGYENEVYIRSLLEEQDALKGQISQLEGMLQQLRLQPVGRASSFATKKSETSREADASHQDANDDDSFIRRNVDRLESRSVGSHASIVSASGRKRVRRTSSRKSSSSSRQQRSQRSVSSTSKRSRHQEDTNSINSHHIPQEIEMCSDNSQDEAEAKVEVEDADSYESFDSEELRVNRGAQALASPSVARRRLKLDISESDNRSQCSRASSKRRDISPKDSGASVRSSTPKEEEIELAHVTDERLVDPFNETGVYTGTVNAATGVPHGKGRFNYDIPG